jgi:hypothetical protein
MGGPRVKKALTRGVTCSTAVGSARDGRPAGRPGATPSGSPGRLRAFYANGMNFDVFVTSPVVILVPESRIMWPAEPRPRPRWWLLFLLSLLAPGLVEGVELLVSPGVTQIGLESVVVVVVFALMVLWVRQYRLDLEFDKRARPTPRVDLRHPRPVDGLATSRRQV